MPLRLAVPALRGYTLPRDGVATHQAGDRAADAGDPANFLPGLPEGPLPEHHILHRRVGPVHGVQRDGPLRLPQRGEIPEGSSSRLHGLQRRPSSPCAEDADAAASTQRSGSSCTALVSAPVPAGGSLNVRSYGGFFLVVVIPIVHVAGGFFILDFLLSGPYTWGRTLRTLVLFMSNLVLAYEFVYRDLQARHTDWSDQRLLKSVLTYSVFPFCVGMAGLVLLLAATRLMK